GDQTILPYAWGILLVVKGDRAELVHSLTALSQVPNVALVAGRGDDHLGAGAQLPAAIDVHRFRTPAAHRRPIDAGDEGAGLDTTQPHGGRFAGHGGVPHIDVLVPALQMGAGIKPQGEVAAARTVRERLIAQGGVGGPAAVTQERLDAAGGVGDACGVVTERVVAGGGIGDAGGVVRERVVAAGGVEGAGVVAQERRDAAGGVEGAGVVARERLEAAGGVFMAGGVEEERPEAAGGVLIAGGVAGERARATAGVRLGIAGVIG